MPDASVDASGLATAVRRASLAGRPSRRVATASRIGTGRMNRPIVAIPATDSTASTPIAVQDTAPAHPAQGAPARRIRIAARTTPLITNGMAISSSARAPWA